MNKLALRSAMRAVRRDYARALAPAQRTALHVQLGRTVAAGLAGHPPGWVGGYWPTGWEIDPRPALAALAGRGWRIALPCVSGEALVFRAWPDIGCAPPPGFQGIPEPDAHLPAVVPDVLLVPLLAATLAGGRLGQGKGFYDRTLAATPAFAVGLLYVVQLVEALPLDPWDRALAALATPDRWIVP